MGMGDIERLEDLVQDILDILRIGKIFGANIHELSKLESKKENQLEKIQTLINDYIEMN
jgi:hypothetical protein